MDGALENAGMQLASPEVEGLCNYPILRSGSPEVEHVAQKSLSSPEVELLGSSPMTQAYVVSPEVEADSAPEVDLVRKSSRLVQSVSPEVETSVKQQKADMFESKALESTEVDESLSVIRHQISNRGNAGVGIEVVGAWSIFESGKSSTWRETEAVRRVMQSNRNVIRGKKVKVYSDNKNVKSVLKSGSKRDELQIIASEVSDICDKHEIELSVEWIPRHSNERSDYLSLCKDSDDWSVRD